MLVPIQIPDYMHPYKDLSFLPDMLKALPKMTKKKDSETLSIWLVPLLLFFALDIILTLIYGSLKTRPIQTQDFYIEDEEDRLQNWDSPEPTWSITCDRSHYEYDLCYINRPLVMDPKYMILHSVDPTNSTPASVEKIRPYPRKWQPDAMEKVKEVTLTLAPPNSPCDVTHTSPALVFSAGGFNDNVFHAYSEGFIPLFITVDSFFADQDVILVIVDCNDSWVKKYEDLIPRFTRHPIINLNKEIATHCFPSAIVGLVSHGAMTVDPTVQRGPSPKTILDFRAVLETTYGRAWPSWAERSDRPRLVLMGRNHHRVILNQDEILQAAKNVGFDVIVFEPHFKTPVHEIFKVIESSHAMLGVHGAGLTNELFLRTGAVFMQIVPLKNGWVGDICYGKLAIRLGLEYIVYNVATEESSLAKEYPKEKLDPNDQVLDTNQPDWSIYMQQNVTINLNRFRVYLKRAYSKARKFMQKQSS